MRDTVTKLLALFDPRERRRLAGVLVSVIAMGLLQVAGVGSVIPFIALLSNPSLAQQNAVLAWLYETFGFATTHAFLIFIGFGVMFLLIAGNAFIAFTIWLITRFAWDNQYRLSDRLLSGYLAQPYEAFLNRNSADTGKNILYESQQFANGVLLPAMRIVAFGVTVLFLAAMLLALNPSLAVLVAGVFGLAYLAVYVFVRRPLVRIGQRRMTANTGRFKAVDQAFGSVKELKVLGREADFVAQYRPAAHTFANGMAVQQVLATLPRYAIEGVAFGFVMGLFLYLLAIQGSVHEVLPLAGAFALAGYRMLPAFQQVYQGVSALRFNQPVLDTMYRDLITHGAATGNLPVHPTLQSFKRELRLEAVTYTYPSAAAPALREINLAIPRNAFVAFVGATGSGKTTLAGVILGLLRPQVGLMIVDGAPVTDANRRAWQANLGYVPQEVYLIDDTIAANIAYGVPRDERDRVAVQRAARIASIHDFITDLPRGYNTVVGERGVRLSGGQRQRIGIARALYRDPQVLVLDEATSALDNETEQRIVEDLDAMRGGRTLIVIAHRLSTVRRSSRLHLLEAGRIVASGHYDELVSSSAAFRRLTRSAAVG